MEISHQFSTWRLKNEPKPEKPRQSHSKAKVMLTLLFDFRSNMHFKSLPLSLPAVLKSLKDIVHCKRPELWPNNLWILHDDLVSLD